MANPADQGDLVLLEALAGPPAVPEAAPPELTLEFVDRERHPGGEALDDDDESLAVGFSGGEVAQHRTNLPAGLRP